MGIFSREKKIINKEKEGKTKMAKKITKTELNNLIVRYAAANEEKKPLVNECKALSEEIKDAMADRGVTTFAAMGWTATVTFKNGRKLDLAKVEKLLGGKIPEECYIHTITPTLTVTAAKSVALPKVEGIKAIKAA